VPTIFLYHLTSLTSLREAPNGSIKRAEPGREGGRNEFDTSSERDWTIFGEADSPIGRCSGLHSGFPAIHAQSQEPVLTACPGVRLDADPPVTFIFRLRHGGGPYIPVCTSTSRLLETPLRSFLSLFPVSEGIRFVQRCTRAHSPRRCVYCHGREAPIPEDGHADCGGSTRTICPPRTPV
jgi:hypothetical protein